MNTIQEAWYEPWIEELRALITQGEFAARWGLIETYHKVGQEILAKHDHFDRAKIYGEEIVQRVGLSLGYSRSTIFYAVQFAKKYPDLATLPGGNNMSWRQVLALLPGGDGHAKVITLEERLMMFATPDVQKNPNLPYTSTLSLKELIKAKPESEKRIVVHKAPDQAINRLISFFKQTYKTTSFPNEKLNRYACKRLLDKHGEEKVQGLIKAASAVSGEKYAPTIFSFLDLEKKLMPLVAFYQRQKSGRKVFDV